MAPPNYFRFVAKDYIDPLEGYTDWGANWSTKWDGTAGNASYITYNSGSRRTFFHSAPEDNTTNNVNYSTELITIPDNQKLCWDIEFNALASGEILEPTSESNENRISFMTNAGAGQGTVYFQIGHDNDSGSPSNIPIGYARPGTPNNLYPNQNTEGILDNSTDWLNSQLRIEVQKAALPSNTNYVTIKIRPKNGELGFGDITGSMPSEGYFYHRGSAATYYGGETHTKTRLAIFGAVGDLDSSGVYVDLKHASYKLKDTTY